MLAPGASPIPYLIGKFQMKHYQLMPSAPKPESIPALGPGNGPPLLSFSGRLSPWLDTSAAPAGGSWAWPSDLVLWAWVESRELKQQLPPSTHPTDSQYTVTALQQEWASCPEHHPGTAFLRVSGSLSWAPSRMARAASGLCYMLHQSLLAPGHGCPLGPLQAAVREKKFSSTLPSSTGWSKS